MQIFGRFQTTSELARTGLGSVFAAKLFDANDDNLSAVDASPFVVKTCSSAAGLLGDEAAAQLCKAFSERAEVHRKVTRSGDSKHWAPIHEIGDSKTGPFFVSDRFERSAQKLLTGRVKLKPDALFKLIDSVLAGLLELKNTQHRAHGNLKPSNVLISSADFNDARIVITDPATAAEAEERGGEAEDLRAVGELLHQVVTFRPSDSSDQPIASTAEWMRLGSSNKSWRELCAALLNYSGSSELDLTEARRRLSVVNDRRDLPIAKIATSAAIAIVVIIFGITAWSYFREQSNWKLLTAAYDNWFRELQEHLNNDQVQARWSADDSLRQIVDSLKQARIDHVELEPAAIAGVRGSDESNSPSPAPFAFGITAKTKTALDEIRAVEASLSPDHWSALHDWTRRQQDDSVKGLEAPAAFLAALLADAQIDPATHAAPAGGTALVSAIDNLLALKTPAGARNFRELEALASELLTQDQAFRAGTPNAFLQQLSQRNRTLAATLPGDSKSQPDRGLHALLEQMRSRDEQGRQLTTFVRTEWNESGLFDQARFNAEFSAGDPTAESAARDWLAAARLYRIDNDARTAQLDLLEHARKDAADAITQLKSMKLADDSIARNFDDRLTKIVAKVQALRGRNWIAADTANHVGDDIVKDFATLNADLEHAIATVAVRPEDWLEASRDIKVPQDAIRDAYRAKFSELCAGETSDSLRNDPQKFAKLRHSVDDWQTLFVQLSRRLPASAPTTLPTSSPALAGATLDPAFAAAIGKRLSALTQQAIGTAIVDDPATGFKRIDDAKLDAAIADYEAWKKSLNEIARGASDATTVLDEGGDLNDTVNNSPSPAMWESTWRNALDFKNDPSIAAAVAPLLKRIADLHAAARWTSDQAASALNDNAVAPELKVAALRNLLGSGGAPPRSAESFARESTLRNALDAQLQANVKSVTRREVIRLELANAAPAHWAAYVNSLQADANIEASLATAFAASDTFNVKDRTDQLSPRARFNVALYNLRTHLKNDADADPSPAVTEFTNRVNALPARDLDSSKAGAMTAAIKRFLAPPLDGPPVAAFQITALDANDHVRRYTHVGDKPGPPIEFVRVEHGDMIPFYVCKTELSVGVFIDVINSPTNTLLRDSLPKFSDATDPRAGPRGWHWEADGMHVGWPRVWLPEKILNTAGIGRFNYYAEGIGDPRFQSVLRVPRDEPGPQQPLQQVSPKFAISLAEALGCRLPTSDEWKVTYDAFPPPVADRNLRDRTWAKQLQYVNSLALPQNLKRILSPLAGVFRENVDAVEVPTVATDDKTLWFQQVDAGGGEVVHHLAGNVAEYIYDPDTDHYAVVGGSAMSSPQVPINFPQFLNSETLAQSYADVGLRLAFSAKTSAANRLRHLLVSPQYMPPK